MKVQIGNHLLHCDIIGKAIETELLNVTIGFTAYAEYGYMGNEMEIDSEYYTIGPNLLLYLTDFQKQFRTLPLPNIKIRNITIEITKPDNVIPYNGNGYIEIIQ